MTAPSSLFSVNGSTVVQAHAVNYGAVVTFAIQSLTGVSSIAWEIVGTSKSDQAALAITPSGTPSGATATVTMPSDPGDGLGRAFGIKLTVANSVGEASSTYRIFGKANSAGIIPAVAGEELWRDSTHGYTDIFNQALNAIGGAAGGAGQLLYNNAGAVDSTSGITVVGSETALDISGYLELGAGTVATAALLRFANNPGAIANYRSYAGNNRSIIHLSGDGSTFDDLLFGDSNATDGNSSIYLRAKVQAVISLAGNNEFSFSTTALDCNQNSIIDIGFLGIGATSATAGYIRLPQATAGTYALVGLNGTSSAEVVLIGMLSDNVVRVGDPTNAAELDLRSSGNIDFVVGANTEFRMSATGMDCNGNALTEVGDFDHDGANLGFYGTAPTTKKTVTGIRQSNTALASLLTQLAAVGLITDSTTAT